MSSDKSEVDEEMGRVKRYVVLSFSQKSQELKWAKKKLDRSYQDLLPGHSKRIFIPREQEGNHQTNRNQPTAQIGHVVSIIPQNMCTNQQVEISDDDGLDAAMDLKCLVLNC